MYVYRFVDKNVRKQKGRFKEDDKKTKTRRKGQYKKEESKRTTLFIIMNFLKIVIFIGISIVSID